MAKDDYLKQLPNRVYVDAQGQSRIRFVQWSYTPLYNQNPNKKLVSADTALNELISVVQRMRSLS